VALIFQPAEEGGGGAGVMVEEGIMERFDIGSVYALHNMPGEAAGSFYTTPGPIMAAADTFHIHITGQGGHGAYPNACKDPIVAGLPDTAYINGTVRTFDLGVQEMVIARMQAICEGHAAAYGVEIRFEFEKGYPPTINHAREAGFAASVAREIAGEACVRDDASPEMGAEDFAYMLQARPGAYLRGGGAASPGI